MVRGVIDFWSDLLTCWLARPQTDQSASSTVPFFKGHVLQRLILPFHLPLFGARWQALSLLAQPAPWCESPSWITVHMYSFEPCLFSMRVITCSAKMKFCGKFLNGFSFVGSECYRLWSQYIILEHVCIFVHSTFWAIWFVWDSFLHFFVYFGLLGRWFYLSSVCTIHQHHELMTDQFRHETLVYFTYG